MWKQLPMKLWSELTRMSHLPSHGLVTLYYLCFVHILRGVVGIWMWWVQIICVSYLSRFKYWAFISNIISRTPIKKKISTTPLYLFLCRLPKYSWRKWITRKVYPQFHACNKLHIISNVYHPESRPADYSIAQGSTDGAISYWLTSSAYFSQGICLHKGWATLWNLAQHIPVYSFPLLRIVVNLDSLIVSGKERWGRPRGKHLCAAVVCHPTEAITHCSSV